MKQNKRDDHVMIYYEIVFITFISRDSHRSMMPFDVPTESKSRRWDRDSCEVGEFPTN